MNITENKTTRRFTIVVDEAELKELEDMLGSYTPDGSLDRQTLVYELWNDFAVFCENNNVEVYE